MRSAKSLSLIFCVILFVVGITFVLVARASDLPPASQRSVAYSVPGAGINFDVSSQAAITLSTYTIGGPPGVSADKMCGPPKFVDIPVVSDGWLLLTLSVPADQRKTYVAWLGAPSESIGARSNNDLLSGLWHALARGFDSLAGDEVGRPRVVRYLVRTTPADCTYVEKLQFKRSAATKLIEMPIAVHDPGLLGPVSASLMQALFEIAAHETTHILNMYPYTAERLRWLHSSEAVAAHDPSVPTSMDVEVRAVSVERCMRRLIMPSPEGFDYFGDLWAGHRTEFEERVRQEPILRIWARAFEREYQSVGVEMMANADKATLQLLGQCAAYLRRKQMVDAYPVPNVVERRAAVKAFNSVRQTWLPVHFQGYSYLQ